MNKLKIAFGNKKTPLLLALLPILLVFGVIVFKSVDVPYWDQWEFVPIIQHIHSGHFYFNDFWSQQNEHRLLLPRLVMLAAASLDHWNIRVESLISFVIAVASFLVIIKTAGITRQANKRKMSLFLPLLLSLIWFSPVQVENWLWGWQIQWFLNVFGVVLATLGIARIRGKELAYPDVLLIIAGGLIAQYSLGNGTLVWPIVVAALLYARVQIRRTAIIGAAGLAATAAYYHSYLNPAGTPPKSLIFKEPGMFIKYTLTYLGRPLGFSHIETPLLGLLLLVVFGVVTVYLLLKRRDLFRLVLPWTALALYALGSAIITALARLGLGVDQAYSSRYTTISSLFLVGTLMICIECRSVFMGWFGKNYRVIKAAAAIVVFALVLSNVGWGLHAADARSHDLKAEQACTRGPDPSNTCLLTAYPNTSVVRARLNYLKQLHWGGY